MRHAVRVIWRDSETNDGWTNYKDLKSEKLDVESLGFIVYHDDKSLTIAHSVSGDGDKPEQVNGRLTIPRECIVDIEWLI